MERLILFLIFVGCGIGAWLTSEPVVVKEFVVVEKSKVDGLHLFYKVDGETRTYAVDETEYIEAEVGEPYVATKMSGLFWALLIISGIFLIIWAASLGIDLSDLLDVLT